MRASRVVAFTLSREPVNLSETACDFVETGVRPMGGGLTVSRGHDHSTASGPGPGRARLLPSGRSAAGSQMARP